MQKQHQTSKISQAIDDIVSANTLPPQIDYAAPYRAKADKAEAFLNTLSEGAKNEAYRQITERIESYYAPSIKGEDGEYYSIAALDAKF